MRRLLFPTILGLGMLCAVCGGGAGVLWFLGSSQSGLSIHAIPVYPGATDVTVQDLNSPSFVGVVGTSSTAQLSTGSVHILGSGVLTGGMSSIGDSGFIGFTTTDSAQQVYAFYDASLTKAGWTTAASRGSMSSSLPVSVVGASPISHSYVYRSPLPWLPLLSRPDTLLFVFVDSQSNGTANEGTIFLMQGP